mmetsp:Transcript_431/g.1307  ORF Transcript_431/g.1307 Transcript_431/m.1307 type:complete len:353 (-) Transcript_431:252-1310(-)
MRAANEAPDGGGTSCVAAEVSAPPVDAGEFFSSHPPAPLPPASSPPSTSALAALPSSIPSARNSFSLDTLDSFSSVGVPDAPPAPFPPFAFTSSSPSSCTFLRFFSRFFHLRRSARVIFARGSTSGGVDVATAVPEATFPSASPFVERPTCSLSSSPADRSPTAVSPLGPSSFGASVSTPPAGLPSSLSPSLSSAVFLRFFFFFLRLRFPCGPAGRAVAASSSPLDSSGFFTSPAAPSVAPRGCCSSSLVPLMPSSMSPSPSSFTSLSTYNSLLSSSVNCSPALSLRNNLRSRSLRPSLFPNSALLRNRSLSSADTAHSAKVAYKSERAFFFSARSDSCLSFRVAFLCSARA